MSEVSSVSSTAYTAQTQVILNALQQTMQSQEAILQLLMESMGVGQNLDIQA